MGLHTLILKLPQALKSSGELINDRLVGDKECDSVLKHKPCICDTLYSDHSTIKMKKIIVPER